MSDAIAVEPVTSGEATKVLVPKGWKKCPKCSELVKGPRTGTCPHCKADISKAGKKAAKATKAKSGRGPGRPRKVVATTVELPKATCPFTFNEFATIGNLQGIKRNSTISRVTPALYPQTQRFRDTMMYLDSVQTPEPVEVENYLTFAVRS